MTQVHLPLLPPSFIGPNTPSNAKCLPTPPGMFSAITGVIRVPSLDCLNATCTGPMAQCTNATIEACRNSTVYEAQCTLASNVVEVRGAGRGACECVSLSFEHVHASAHTHVASVADTYTGQVGLCAAGYTCAAGSVTPFGAQCQPGTYCQVIHRQVSRR